MAKFLAYYNLCPIHDPKEFLGIAQDRDKANIIATLDKNIVMIIKISTQKQVRSWSMVDKFSSKVVYDHRSQKYVGVIANRTLRCWDETSSDINKCKKLKFQKSIADLITIDEQTFVLYSDGKCEILAKAIESRKAEIDTLHERSLVSINSFSGVNISRISGGYYVLTYFNRNNNTGELELIRTPLEGGAPSRFSLKRENMNVRVAGYAVIEGDEAPMLLTIWSDKRLFLLNLTDSTMPETSPGDFVSVVTPLDVDNPLSVLGISKHLVAIYGANSGQDGVSLLLYNTQFKLIKARQYFKVYFNFSRLWAMDNYILLAMGQNLSVVTYQISKELLAELVGTQSNNNFQALVEYINEEEVMQEILLYAPGSENCPSVNKVVERVQSAIVELNNVDADGKLQPFENPCDFDCTLNYLSKLNMCVDLESALPGFEDAQINLMASGTDNWGTVNLDVQVVAHYLEQCGSSEHEITEKLLPMLIKMDLMQDIVMCLRRYKNISEKTLAKTLSYALGKLEAVQLHPNTASEVNIRNGCDDFRDTGSIFSTAFQTLQLLNAVLSCPFDTTAIAVHICNDIDYPKVLLLLGHLYEELESPKGKREERLLLEPVCVDFELQLLRWFGVCLNAHFQKLALSKEMRLIELLLKWHRLFAGYKDQVIELEQLSALLYNILRQKRIRKAKHYSKWYSVEEMILY